MYYIYYIYILYIYILIFMYIIYKYAQSIIPKQTNKLYTVITVIWYILRTWTYRTLQYSSSPATRMFYHTLSLSNVSLLLTVREALVDSVQRHGRGFVQSKVKEEYNNTLTVQGLQSASLGSWFPVQLRLYDHCRFFLNVFWGCYGLGEKTLA